MLFRRHAGRRAKKQVRSECEHDGLTARCFACCVANGFGVLVPAEAVIAADERELYGS